MLVFWKPKKFKFKRLHKGIVKKCCYRPSASKTHHGVFGIKILKSARLTAKQLEQANRRFLTVRKKREKYKFWFKCLPDIPITQKPLGIRMGKGKGNVASWISRAPAGKVIFQLDSSVETTRALKGLSRAAAILPVPTKIYINKMWYPKSRQFKIL